MDDPQFCDSPCFGFRAACFEFACPRRRAPGPRATRKKNLRRRDFRGNQMPRRAMYSTVSELIAITRCATRRNAGPRARWSAVPGRLARELLAPGLGGVRRRPDSVRKRVAEEANGVRPPDLPPEWRTQR